MIAGLALMFVILVLAFNSFRFTLYLLCIVPLSIHWRFCWTHYCIPATLIPFCHGYHCARWCDHQSCNYSHGRYHQTYSHRRRTTICRHCYRSCQTRLRPIFLTTITTVIGMNSTHICLCSLWPTRTRHSFRAYICNDTHLVAHPNARQTLGRAEKYLKITR